MRRRRPPRPWSCGAGPSLPRSCSRPPGREQTVYTWREQPLACVSVEAVTPDWPIDRVLSEHLTTRTTYATTTVAEVVEAGLVLLPTFAVPHYDVVLEDASPQEVAKLMSILSEPMRNPHRRTGRRA